jgi:hypothetical protein
MRKSRPAVPELIAEWRKAPTHDVVLVALMPEPAIAALIRQRRLRFAHGVISVSAAP